MANEGNVYMQTQNGTVYSSGYFYYYMPNSYSSTPDTAVFYPGAGGDDGYVLSTFCDYINRNNPNEIILISKGCSTSQELTENMLGYIENEYGVSLVNNTDYYGFSKGAETAFKNSVLDIQNNGSTASKNIVLIESACNGQYLPHDTDTIQTLKENGSSILMFEGPKYSGRAEAYVQPSILALAQAGIPIVIAENARFDNAPSFDSFHTAIFENTIQNNVIGYINGEVTDLNDIDNYRFKIYDSATNSWREIDKDEARSYLNNSGCAYIGGDFNNLKNIGLLNIDTIMDKYNIDGSLRSDMEFLVQKVNRIRDCIMSTNFLSGFDISQYTSTSKVPSLENQFLREYYKTSNILLNYIVQETEAMISIAASIDDLDARLSSQTVTLNEAIESLNGGSINSNQVSSELSSSHNNSAALTNIAAVAAIPTMVAVDAAVSNHDTYTDVVSAATAPVAVPSSEMAPFVNPTKEEVFLDFDNLKVDPNIEIIDYGDYKAVYHYDPDGKIDNYEYYYDYENGEEARESLEAIRTKYGKTNDVEYVTLKDKQIKIVFKKEYLKKLANPSNIVKALRGGRYYESN